MGARATRGIRLRARRILGRRSTHPVMIPSCSRALSATSLPHVKTACLRKKGDFTLIGSHGALLLLLHWSRQSSLITNQRKKDMLKREKNDRGGKCMPLRPIPISSRA